MKLQRLLSVGAAASLVGLLLFSAPALAADAEEITISPASLKLEAKAGQSTSGTFKVINTGNVDLKFSVYASPYSVINTEYSPDYSVENKRNVISKHVTLSVTEGTLKPREEQVVSYSIAAPADAAPGSHYTVLFAETVPSDSDGGVVVRTKRVGALARITVDGERIEDARTESITVPWWHWKSKLTANIHLDNTGNVDLDATTSIMIKSLIGRKLHFEQRTNAVFPDNPRVISYEWGSKWKAGIYRVEVSSSIDGEDTTISKLVVLAPAWAVALLAILVLACLMLYGMRKINSKAE